MVLFDREGGVVASVTVPDPAAGGAECYRCASSQRLLPAPRETPPLTGPCPHALPSPAAAEFLYAEEALTPVVQLAWHPASTHLAVLPRGSSFAMVWTAAGGTARMDSGIKVRREEGAASWLRRRPILVTAWLLCACCVLRDISPLPSPCT